MKQFLPLAILTPKATSSLFTVLRDYILDVAEPWDR